MVRRQARSGGQRLGAAISDLPAVLAEGYTFTGLGGGLLVVELTLARRRRRSPSASPTAVPIEPAAYVPRRSSVAPVGTVLAAAVGGELLDGAAGDDLVERGFLVAGLAEDAAEALDVLADGGRAGEDDGDVRLGDVDPFVQDPRGRHDRLRPVVELQETSRRSLVLV